MIDNLTLSWHVILYPLAALAYIEILRRLDRHWAQRRPLTDEEVLAHHARQNALSEYDVFHIAASRWSVSRNRAEEDFRTYLQRGMLPHYVRDYLRGQSHLSAAVHTSKKER